jgi:hypothetical protein
MLKRVDSADLKQRVEAVLKAAKTITADERALVVRAIPRQAARECLDLEADKRFRTKDHPELNSAFAHWANYPGAKITCLRRDAEGDVVGFRWELPNGESCHLGVGSPNEKK